MFLRTPVHVAQLVPLLVFVTLDSAQPLTHPDDSSTSALSQLKTVAHPTSQQIRCKLCMVAAVLTRGTRWRTWPVSTAPILRVPTTDSSGISRTFSSTVRMCSTCHSWLGKSAEERNGASVMLDILAGTKNMTTAAVAAEIVSHTRAKTQWTKGALRGACGNHCRTRLGCEEVHGSVPKLVGRGTSRSKREQGQEGLEASTSVNRIPPDTAIHEQMTT